MQLWTSLCCYGNWFQEAPSPDRELTVANCIAPDSCEKNCCVSSHSWLWTSFSSQLKNFHGSLTSQHAKYHVRSRGYQETWRRCQPTLAYRPTFSKSLVVSVAVSKLGCWGLVFVDPGAKINDIYYRDELLFKRFLPPAIRSTSRRYVTV